MSNDGDPYHILNLPREPGALTPDQVKTHYKLLAKQLHPDKNRGRFSREESTAAFQALTAAYRAVIGDVRSHEAASMHKMKEQFSDFLQQQQARTRECGDNNPKKFSLASFNAQFERDRLADPEVDTGYEAWMKEQDSERSAATAAQVRKSKLAMSLRTGPEAASLGPPGRHPGGSKQITFSELGIEHVDDYGNVGGNPNRLTFTDYQVAHITHRLVDAEDIEQHDRRPQFKDLRSFERYRAHNIRFDMTEEEQEVYARDMERLSAIDERRRHVLQKRDDMALKRFGTRMLSKGAS